MTDGSRNELCPYCEQEVFAEFVHNGFGLQQVTPFACQNCKAYEAGPYDNPTKLLHADLNTGWYPPEPKREGNQTMHKSRLIYLFNEAVITVKAKYEPELPKTYEFKTLRTDLEVGDICVVTSGTRCEFTTVEIVEVDVDTDVESGNKIDWIVDKVDTKSHKDLLEQEGLLEARYAQMKRRKKRAELRADIAGDESGEFDDIALVTTKTDTAIEPPAQPDEVTTQSFTTSDLHNAE